MTPRYRVRLTSAAQRQLDRLRGPLRIALRGAVVALASEPRPRGALKLRARTLWRVRVRIDGAPWRIVYQVRDAGGLIIVTKIVRRDDGTYRRP